MGCEPQSPGHSVDILIRFAAAPDRSENYRFGFNIIAEAVHADSEPPLAFAFGDAVKFLDLVTLG